MPTGLIFDANWRRTDNVEKYPEQWVVVKDCALILASANEMDVLAVVERHSGTVVVDRMQPRRSVHAVTER